EQRGRLGVGFPLAIERAAAAAQEGAQARPFEAYRAGAVVGHLGGDPAADVGHAEEPLAVGRHDEARPAAEARRAGREHEPAAELEPAEADGIGPRALEVRNRPRRNLDGVDAGGWWRVLVLGANAERRQGGGRSADEASQNAASIHSRGQT